jgi:hypothetical protein
MLLVGIAALVVWTGCSASDVTPAWAESLEAGPYLVLEDAASGEHLGVFSLPDGRFTVSFRHSVNQTMVHEEYAVQDGVIYLEACRYYSFGAGVPTEVPEGVTLTYDEDGAMVLTGFHRPIDPLIYSVSRVYDHLLDCGGGPISLGERFGHGTHVRFSYALIP